MGVDELEVGAAVCSVKETNSENQPGLSGKRMTCRNAENPGPVARRKSGRGRRRRRAVPCGRATPRRNPMPFFNDVANGTRRQSAVRFFQASDSGKTRSFTNASPLSAARYGRKPCAYWPGGCCRCRACWPRRSGGLPPEWTTWTGRCCAPRGRSPPAWTPRPR